MDKKVQTNKQEALYFNSFTTSFCKVYIAKGSRGVCKIFFPCNSERSFLMSLNGLFRIDKSLADTSSISKHIIPQIKICRNDSILKYEISILKRYFKGGYVSFDFPMDISNGTQFQMMVWKKLMEIPYGECRSYKWVAEQIGNPNASRAVGMANNKNPLPPVVPCHRVIGSNGKLVGYASGLHIKEKLLQMEYNTVKRRI